MNPVNMDIADLRAFLAVVDVHSFTRAADMLHMSQSALSRRVARLESLLGMPVFERTTRRVTLTAAGRELLPLARRVTADVDNSLLALRGSSLRRGSVSFFCIPSITLSIVPEALRQYRKQYPEIQVRVLDRTSAAGLHGILSGEVDFGIGIAQPPGAEIDFDVLCKDPYVLICDPSHELARVPALRWTDLAGRPLILGDKANTNRILLDSALARHNVVLESCYEASHLSMLVGLAAAGLGAAIVPQTALAGTGYDRLIVRSVSLPELFRSIGVQRRHGSELSPPAADLLNAIKAVWQHWQAGFDAANERRDRK